MVVSGVWHSDEWLGDECRVVLCGLVTSVVWHGDESCGVVMSVVWHGDECHVAW